MKRRFIDPVGGETEDDICDSGLADPTQGERGKGYAKLDGGKELVDGVLELVNRARAGTAERNELLDTCLADADESEFGRYEEAGGKNEEGHHHRAEKHPFQHYGSLVQGPEKLRFCPFIGAEP
jgi:hypothetical protein